MAALSAQRRRALEQQAAAMLAVLRAARHRGDDLAAALAEHDLNAALDELKEASGARSK